jgi:hypothetical protein
VSASDAKESWPCLAIDRARFAAREYIATMDREVAAVGATFQPDRDTTVLAYESGYLRGSNETHEDLLNDLKELRANAREAGRLESENDRITIETELLRRETAALQRLAEAEQHLIEVLQREHEVMLRLQDALASEISATKAMKQLEERIQALEARKAESP